MDSAIEILVADADPPLVARGLPVSHIAAVCVGNALQYYDFITFAFFASQIGRTFFPFHDASHSLFASLATFGVGFVTRPVGAILIGSLADRIGRKPAMVLAFALMGIGITGLAITPSYAQIGIAAPILAILFRMTQGLALGGEVGPSVAYLVEAAPPGRRGLYVSLNGMTSDLAIFVAGLIGLLLSNVLSAADLDGWGWRIAFLIGAAIVPVGLSLRRRLAETLHESPPMEIDRGPPGVRPYVRVALLGIAMLGSATIGSYTLGYMTTFATVTLRMATNLAFGATVVLGLCGVLLDCIGGWLADRFGRKPSMMAPWAFTVVATIPTFWAISHYRNGWALLGGTALLAIPSALGGSAIQVSLTECLPRRIRSGAFASIYAVAIATFGGTAQLIATGLIRVTGNPMSPAWYMAGATAIGLAAMAFVPETAPTRRARSA